MLCRCCWGILLVLQRVWAFHLIVKKNPIITAHINPSACLPWWSCRRFWQNAQNIETEIDYSAVAAFVYLLTTLDRQVFLSLHKRLTSCWASDSAVWFPVICHKLFEYYIFTHFKILHIFSLLFFFSMPFCSTAKGKFLQSCSTQEQTQKI